MLMTPVSVDTLRASNKDGHSNLALGKPQSSLKIIGFAYQKYANIHTFKP